MKPILTPSINLNLFNKNLGSTLSDPIHRPGQRAKTAMLDLIIS